MKGNYHLLYRAMAVTEMASWSMRVIRGQVSFVKFKSLICEKKIRGQSL